MTDWDAVRNRIQARRQALGLSQAELGKLLGLAGSNVAQVEGGLPISEKKLDAFAKALGVSTPFLRYGLVTAFDRATLEADAYRAGRASALHDISGWLDREEARATTPYSPTPHSEEQGAEAFTSENFTEVSAERLAASRSRRASAARSKASTTGTGKKGGRRGR